MNRLSLRGDLPSNNPQMISILSIGEQHMDQSIDKLKGNIDKNDAEAEVKDSTLLRTIQPTMEKQTNDDLLDAERAVSTTFIQFCGREIQTHRAKSRASKTL